MIGVVVGQLGADAGVEIEVGDGEADVWHQDGVRDSGDVATGNGAPGEQDEDRAEQRPDGSGQQDRGGQQHAVLRT